MLINPPQLLVQGLTSDYFLAHLYELLGVSWATSLFPTPSMTSAVSVASSVRVFAIEIGSRLFEDQGKMHIEAFMNEVLPLVYEGVAPLDTVM